MAHKGFAFVTLSCPEAVEAALGRDGVELLGRPVLIRVSSRPRDCDTVIVTGLPPATSEGDVLSLFSTHGPIRCVRLVPPIYSESGSESWPVSQSGSRANASSEATPLGPIGGKGAEGGGGGEEGVGWRGSTAFVQFGPTGVSEAVRQPLPSCFSLCLITCSI